MRKKDTILDLILKEGPMSRQEIISKLNIGRVTAGKIIRKLLEEKKIVEEGKISKGKGRAISILKVNPDLYYILAVSYDGRKIIGGIINLERKILYRDSFPIKKNFVKEIISFIKKLMEDSKIDKRKILSIGISIPGSLDIKRGKVIGLRGKKYWEEVYL
ncbi:ROK family protein, partial [bacterium]|nr:ROK family protein [bacterium]